MPIVNIHRRVDGNLVFGTENELNNRNEGIEHAQVNVPGAIAGPSNALLESIGNLEVSEKNKR